MDKEQILVESLKAKLDCNKHLITLESGLLVLITIFLEELIPTPTWKVLIAVSMASMLISIIASVYLMHSAQQQIQEVRETGINMPPLDHIIQPISGFGFILALLALAIFFFVNFI